MKWRVVSISWMRHFQAKLVNTYRPKKRLGQNFLVDSTVIDRTISVICPSVSDTIVEIGPGHGALTVPLAKSGARIIAIEFDRDVIRKLQQLLADLPNVSVLNQDFLTYSIQEGRPVKLVGNIPYNITTPVITWATRYHASLELVILMVQKELGMRLTASSGSKNWSPISIMCQLYFHTAHCFDVPPSAFRPPPKVTSTVIRLTPKPRPTFAKLALFEQVVRLSFQHRRKLLSNNLVAQLKDGENTYRLLRESLCLRHNTRAEELSIEQFLALTEFLDTHKLLRE